MGLESAPLPRQCCRTVSIASMAHWLETRIRQNSQQSFLARRDHWLSPADGHIHWLGSHMDASASRCGLPQSEGWLPSPSLCLHLYLLYSGRTPQLSLGISVGQDLTRLPRKCYAILGELDIYFGLSFSHWSNHGPRRSSLCG